MVQGKRTKERVDLSGLSNLLKTPIVEHIRYDPLHVGRGRIKTVKKLKFVEQEPHRTVAGFPQSVRASALPVASAAYGRLRLPTNERNKPDDQDAQRHPVAGINR